MAAPHSLRNKQSGSSLVEVLVAAAALGIIALAFTNMIVSQNNQLAIVENKLDRADLKSFMIQTLSSGEACTWQLLNKEIDVSGPTSETQFSPSVINLNVLYSGLDDKSPAIAEVGKAIGSRPNSLKVESISVREIYELSPDQHHAVFQISFASPTTGLPLRPLTVTTLLSTTGAVKSAKKIVGCGESVGGSGDAGAWCGLGSWMITTGGPYKNQNKVAGVSSVSPCSGGFPKQIDTGLKEQPGCPPGYKGKTFGITSETDSTKQNNFSYNTTYTRGSVTCIKSP